MCKQMLAVSHNQMDKPRKPNWRLTILAAVEVCMSFHTVSESTPMPPHSKKQNRIGKFSARRQKSIQVSKTYQKSSLEEDKNGHRLARSKKFSGIRQKMTQVSKRSIRVKRTLKRVSPNRSNTHIIAQLSSHRQTSPSVDNSGKPSEWYKCKSAEPTVSVSKETVVLTLRPFISLPHLPSPPPQSPYTCVSRNCQNIHIRHNNSSS